MLNCSVPLPSMMSDISPKNVWHFYSQSNFYSAQTAVGGPLHGTVLHKPFPHQKKAFLLSESLLGSISLCLTSPPSELPVSPQLSPLTDLPTGKLSSTQSLEQTNLGSSNLRLPKQHLTALMTDLLYLRFQVLCVSSFQIRAFILASMPSCRPVSARYTSLTVGWQTYLSLDYPYIAAA